MSADQDDETLAVEAQLAGARGSLDSSNEISALSSDANANQVPAFDFEQRRRQAEQQYSQVRPLYEAFARTVNSILQESLAAERVAVASIQWRAKDVQSFGRKAAEPAANNADQPHYSDPLQQIKDLAGIRVITFFPRALDQVKEIIGRQFQVLEFTDKGDLLRQEERLGYQSVHYLVSLSPQRVTLPEYARYAGLIAEIQARTILQHAWAEIEHDIQYKSVDTIPTGIRRRFMALAGLLEIADREFQAVQDADDQLRQQARGSITRGDLEAVEITADALKAYLDGKIGPDGRMAQWNYDWTARLLRKLGFSNFEEVDECIRPYDDDTLSRQVFGSRQGQLSRFELLLQAGMGHSFQERHPWALEKWWADRAQRKLDQLSALGIEVGRYRPPGSSLQSLDTGQSS